MTEIKNTLASNDLECYLIVNISNYRQIIYNLHLLDHSGIKYKTILKTLLAIGK